MPYADVNGIRLYYERSGSGTPLLFISGLGGHIAEVPYVVESYSRHADFIAFDGRGCGRSDKPEHDYSIAGYADDAAGLLDALGVQQAVVYGSSMGGMVAQELALLYPERVRALILGCTTAGAIRGARPSPETIQKMIFNQSLSGDDAIEAGWELGYSRAYIEANRTAMFARSRAASQYAAPREAYMRQVIAAAQHDTHDRLQHVTCPVMIIHGELDVMMPVENAYQLKRLMPHAELRILSGMGHGYNLEAQAEADALVIDFVQRHPVGAADAPPASTHAVR